jgi:hypothetical protein
MADRRVQFDFDIEFSNGGSLKGEGFRLDIEGDDISDRALAGASPSPSTCATSTACRTRASGSSPCRRR